MERSSGGLRRIRCALDRAATPALSLAACPAATRPAVATAYWATCCMANAKLPHWYPEALPIRPSFVAANVQSSLTFGVSVFMSWICDAVPLVWNQSPVGC
ncbi:hypothetical protein VTN96DRAFT_5904 [Rasamsonia emersonii]